MLRRWIGFGLAMVVSCSMGCGGRTPPNEGADDFMLSSAECDERGGTIVVAGDAGMAFCPATFDNVGNIEDRGNAVCCLRRSAKAGG